jgi:hypothetical protein
VSFEPAAFLNSHEELLTEALFGDVPKSAWRRGFPAVDFLVSEDYMGLKANLSIEIVLTLRGEKSPIRVKRLISLHSLMTLSEATAISVIGDDVSKMIDTLRVPRVLERDPRIGMVFSNYDPMTSMKYKWPRMPLCDVSGGSPRHLNPHLFVAASEVYLQANALPRGVPRLVPNEKFACPFCGANNLVECQAESPQSVVWAGGNLGWVHSDCAPWLTPRLQM